MTIAKPPSVPDLYRDYVNLSSTFGVEPVVVQRGRGAVLTDVDGRDFLDCFAGIAVVAVGHCHPRVVEAATAQLRELIYCGTYLYYVPIAGLLAERLARVTPGRLSRTFFCNSGAEAVEGALRLARAYTGRSEVIALETGFHGRTGATLAVTGNRKRKQRGGPYPAGAAFAPAPNPYRCRLCSGTCTLACADAVRDVIDYHTADDVAAFIAEPVMGEAGIVVPPPEYFRRLRPILEERGILLIADEVQSGFARTGTMFGIERYGVEPDIMAMAKGIAAGLPLGGFIARPEVAEAFEPGEHFSTFGGSPVACAAALASLDVIEDERLCEHARVLGECLGDGLRQLATRHPLIGDVRGTGLMFGVELVTDRAAKTPAPGAANRVRAACRERGLLVGVGGFAGNVVRIQPPLVISQAQLDLAMEVLDQALGEAGA
jgi:4-aminobutyrate aminotransferase / (S)-3-amino-2-methylpropionate transaminase / 5-aminovalerate transaminase